MNNIKELLNFIICFTLMNLSGGVLFLPNLFDKVPTAFKVVCHSKNSLTNSAPSNLFCKNDAKIKIFDSKSGQQNKELCFHLSDKQLDDEPCNDVIETTQILKQKCDGKELCTIDLIESFPCSTHINSYLNISYSCVPKHVPYKSFAIARFGQRKLRKNQLEPVKFQNKALNKNFNRQMKHKTIKINRNKPNTSRPKSLKNLFKSPTSLRLIN